MDKHRVSIWGGYIGGGAFFILNLATRGEIPGGFQGGVLGFALGYALVRFGLAFFPNPEQERHSAQAPPPGSTS